MLKIKPHKKLSNKDIIIAIYAVYMSTIYTYSYVQLQAVVTS